MKINPILACGLTIWTVGNMLHNGPFNHKMVQVLSVSMGLIAFAVHHYRNKRLENPVNSTKECPYCRVRLGSLAHLRCTIFTEESKGQHLENSRQVMNKGDVLWVKELRKSEEEDYTWITTDMYELIKELLADALRNSSK